VYLERAEIKTTSMVVFNFDSVTTIPCEREGRVIRANCYVYNAKDEDEADSLIDYLNSQLGAKEWPEKQ